MIGIQNPSSTDKDWNPVPGIRNPESKTVLDSLTWGHHPAWLSSQGFIKIYMYHRLTENQTEPGKTSRNISVWIIIPVKSKNRRA